MTKLNRIPDAVFSGLHDNFTMINNEILRNPKLSSKAKTILSLLLSNKKGWKTYVKTLSKFMKEGNTSITTGIKELKEFGYLLQISYRDKITKKMKGSFIAYTQEPFTFDLEYNKKLLEMYNCELVLKNEKNRTIEKPTVRKTDGSENRSLIILNNNNTNNNTTSCDEDLNGNNKSNSSIETNNTKPIQNKKYITPSMFEKFYSLYPKKADKGKALNAWNKLCNKKQNERPIFSVIIKAIKKQSKTKRWQTKQYIPLPATWLNQNRWLDEIEPMNIDYEKQNDYTKNKNNFNSRKQITKLDNQTLQKLKDKTTVCDY